MVRGWVCFVLMVLVNALLVFVRGTYATTKRKGTGGKRIAESAQERRQQANEPDRTVKEEVSTGQEEEGGEEGDETAQRLRRRRGGTRASRVLDRESTRQLQSKGKSNAPSQSPRSRTQSPAASATRRGRR